MGECSNCGEEGRHTAFDGDVYCDECWEAVKDWTPEKQAELDRLSKEISAWLPGVVNEILKENGVDSGAVCLRCRKVLRLNEQGDLSCDCCGKE